MANTPVAVSFDNEDVKRSLERPRLKAPAWYKFVVKNADVSGIIEKNGNVIHKLTCAPLDGNDTPRFPTVQMAVFPPLTNTDWVSPEGEPHKAPQPWGAENYLLAAAPDRFVRPNKDHMTSAEYKEAQYELRYSVYREMQERHGDKERYVGDTFFGKVENDGAFQNIKKVSPTEPLDAEVLLDDFIDRDYTGDE